MRSLASLRGWHRWLGLAVLVVLFAVSVTGTVLAYKKELVHLLVAPGSVLPADLDPAGMALDLDRIAARFPPEERELIKAPNAEEPYWTLTGRDGHVRLLAIDSLVPYTDRTWLLDALDFVRRLHVALLGGVTGEIVLLSSGLASIALTVIGIVLWWPSRARWRWEWVKPHSLASPRVLQHHRHFGAVLALPLLLLILTGTAMLWQKNVGPLGPAAHEATHDHRLPSTAPPSRFLTAALEQVPNGWPTYIRLGVPEAPEVGFRFRMPGEWHPNGRTSVTFGPEPNRVRVSLADRSPPLRRLLNQLYPLHAGYGMSALYALLVAATGIAAGWLCLSGLSSWLGRRRAARLREEAAALADDPVR
ncbi:MAG TPA: PepSY-associated TM helix domain-containing protein [Pseudomonadales bacterium]